MNPETLVSVTAGLRRDSPPMRLFEKAKRLGAWNPSDIVEGVLAETGYHVYFSALESRGLLPGQRQAIRLIKQDESRHIAYGVFLLSRLIAADDRLWNVLEETMSDLLNPALGMVKGAFSHYEQPPFGLNDDEFVGFATRQYRKRLDRIRRARGATLDEIDRVSRVTIDEDDA